MSNLHQVGGTHYEILVIQPVDMFAKFKLNWFQSEPIKYISRYRNKNGIQDLKKALHILEMGLEKFGNTYFGKLVNQNNIDVETYAVQFRNMDFFLEPQSYYIFKRLLYEIINSEYSEAIKDLSLLMYSEYPDEKY